MKRLKYASRFARPLTPAAIDEIIQVSQENNARVGITGVFMSTGGMFFQVLEGPDDAVDDVFRRIAGDERHTDLVVLGRPKSVESRLFPDWSMRRVEIGGDNAEELEPLVAVLETIADNFETNERLAGVLERGLWRRLRG